MHELAAGSDEVPRNIFVVTQVADETMTAADQDLAFSFFNIINIFKMEDTYG